MRDFITAPPGLTALNGYRATQKALAEIGRSPRRMAFGAEKAIPNRGLSDRVIIVGLGGRQPR